MNDNNSRMVVNGNFKMDNQSYASTLSAGVLEVKGDFSAFRFTAGKWHKLLLSGDTLQTVTLDEYSYLGTLELNNSNFALEKVPIHLENSIITGIKIA